MNNTQMRIWDALCNLTGEEVARLFVDFHGLQILDDDFEGFLELEEVL